MSGIVNVTGARSGVIGTITAPPATAITYEEGTWTVSSTGSMSGANALYTRIGNTCTVGFYGTFSGSPSGDIYFTGLPFSPGTTCQAAGSITIISLESDLAGYYSAIIAGGPTVYIRNGGITGAGDIVATNCDTGTQLWFGMTYLIT